MTLTKPKAPAKAQAKITPPTIGPETAALLLHKAGQEGTRRLTVDLPPDLLDRFTALCSGQGKPKTKIVRAMITDLVDATGY